MGVKLDRSLFMGMIFVRVQLGLKLGYSTATATP